MYIKICFTIAFTNFLVARIMELGIIVYARVAALAGRHFSDVFWSTYCGRQPTALRRMMLVLAAYTSIRSVFWLSSLGSSSIRQQQILSMPSLERPFIFLHVKSSVQ